MADEYDDLFGQVDEEGNEENQDDGGPVRRYSSKSGLMIVVDCSRKMFKKNADGITPFQLAMDITFYTLKRRVITDGASGSQVGLVFYNTNETKNVNSFPNVYELHNLGGIVVDRIKDVRRLSTEEESTKFAEKLSGPTPLPDDCPLERALWLCNFAFSGARFSAQDDQKIWLFTNNADPSQGSDQAKKKLGTRIKDVFLAGQRIFLWPLVDNPSDFEAEVFFKPILAEQSFGDDSELEIEQEEEPIIWVTSEARDNMSEFVKKKDFPKRRLAPMQLDISNDLSISMDLYPLFMRAGVPAKEKFDSRSNAILRRDTKYICKDTLNILTPDQIMTFYNYGKLDRVHVTQEEVTVLKNFGPAHRFTLLGFKPRDLIKPWHVFRSSYFVVPSEKPIKGSTKLFASLLDSLLKRDYVMICSGVLRQSESVKMFAFIPRPELVNKEQTLVDPAGFDVIILPWANDIRQVIPTAVASRKRSELEDAAAPVKEEDAPVPPQEDSTSVDPNMIEKAKALIKKMKLPGHEDTGRFDPLENPAIDKHFTVLQWAVLDNEGDLDWNDEEDDTTKLRDADISKSIRDLAKSFSSTYGGLESKETYEQNEKEKKRKAAAASRGTGSSAPAKKRTKRTDDSETNAAPSNWREMLEKGTITKLKVPELKLILAELGHSQAGKKADLIERIVENA